MRFATIQLKSHPFLLFLEHWAFQVHHSFLGQVTHEPDRKMHLFLARG